jgi:hypothetical protein
VKELTEHFAEVKQNVDFRMPEITLKTAGRNEFS